MRVIVVGAGILGASTAYHLAREGCDVTLIDRADEGRATAAGAGIVCPWGSPIEDPPTYTLLAGGARYYSDFTAMLAEDGEQDPDPTQQRNQRQHRPDDHVRRRLVAHARLRRPVVGVGVVVPGPVGGARPRRPGRGPALERGGGKLFVGTELELDRLGSKGQPAEPGVILHAALAGVAAGDEHDPFTVARG